GEAGVHDQRVQVYLEAGRQRVDRVQIEAVGGGRVLGVLARRGAAAVVRIGLPRQRVRGDSAVRVEGRGLADGDDGLELKAIIKEGEGRGVQAQPATRQQVLGADFQRVHRLGAVAGRD